MPRLRVRELKPDWEWGKQTLSLNKEEFMIKVITFLGDRGGLETVYSYGEKTYTGGVFAEAISQFCQYDEMLVCVTDRAKANTWEVLEKLEDKRIKPIDIPTGRTNEEMWETFKIIAAQVDEGDHVIFDITHGLRSLPFLVFLFAAYLKAAKNVTIDAIYYGALELRESKEAPAPVIDLSEFVGMLDWLTATDRFITTGEGQSLANLVYNAVPSKAELRDDPSTRPLRSHLEKSAKAIETISLALNITRPIETMKSAIELETTLQKAESSFNQRAKPFSLLAEKIINEYGQFALENATYKDVTLDNLWHQLHMIEWYINRDKIIQAVTLAREWLVSVLVFNFNLHEFMFDLHKGRKYAEKALNNGVEKRKKDPRPITPCDYDQNFEDLATADQLVEIWSKMTELRNDIAHVGMNLNPQSAENIKKQAINLYPKIKAIGESMLIKNTDND
ncbi:MAG: TIGR02221 family CRISPR-associated protein [Planktothrix sp. GU0601_MAG3]|nr:MAG: TIGR02221 family CRISPR-associated protein [Planktothrix sp. GU0601_MAG3]